VSMPSPVLVKRNFQTHSTSALADFKVKIKERVVLQSTTIYHSHNLPTLSLPLYFNRPQSTLTGHGRLFSYNSHLKESSLHSCRDIQSKPTDNIEVTPSLAVLTILLLSLPHRINHHVSLRRGWLRPAEQSAAAGYGLWRIWV